MEKNYYKIDTRDIRQQINKEKQNNAIDNNKQNENGCIVIVAFLIVLSIVSYFIYSFIKTKYNEYKNRPISTPSSIVIKNGAPFSKEFVYQDERNNLDDIRELIAILGIEKKYSKENYGFYLCDLIPGETTTDDISRLFDFSKVQFVNINNGIYSYSWEYGLLNLTFQNGILESYVYSYITKNEIKNTLYQVEEIYKKFIVQNNYKTYLGLKADTNIEQYTNGKYKCYVGTTEVFDEYTTLIFGLSKF